MSIFERTIWPAHRHNWCARQGDFERETILRREITPSGKSRAFINDTPVNLTILKSFCSGIIEVHSQHQSLALKDVSNQLFLLDQFCRHNALLKEYKEGYTIYLQLKTKLKIFTEKGEVSLSELEFLSFQLEELESTFPSIYKEIMLLLLMLICYLKKIVKHNGQMILQNQIVFLPFWK